MVTLTEAGLNTRASIYHKSCLGDNKTGSVKVPGASWGLALEQESLEITVQCHSALTMRLSAFTHPELLVPHL